MELLTVRQAAARLTISTRMVYNLVATGSLSHYRIANSIRIAEEGIQDYLSHCRVQRQPVVEHDPSIEPPLARQKKPGPEEPPQASHLKLGPKQLALLRRGGVVVSGPNGRSAG